MQITLYLDIIFCINFLADYIVLWLTAHILKEEIGRFRLVAGAITGAGLFLLFLYISEDFSGVTRVSSLVGISMGTVFITFGKKGMIKKWFCSTTILFLTGSIMNYVKMITNQTVLTLCGWLVFFMVSVSISMFIIYTGRKTTRMTENIYAVEMCNAGKKVYCKVFLDTGNFLRDPLFGKPVLLVSGDVARCCLNDDGCRFLEAYEKKRMIDYSQMPGGDTQQKNCFHEIAFYSVGNPSGKLLCFLIDELRIGGKTVVVCRKQPVAVAPEYLFEKTEYQGLLHKDCF